MSPTCCLALFLNPVFYPADCRKADIGDEKKQTFKVSKMPQSSKRMYV